jgi:lipoprotein-anchoring transpeptidase ErfK/SrfK
MPSESRWAARSRVLGRARISFDTSAPCVLASHPLSAPRRRGLFRQTLPLAILAALVLAAPAWAQEPPPPAPAAPVVPEGVTIAGVPVGGMASEQATLTVQAFFNRHVLLTFRSRVWDLRPVRLGASADVASAVAQAFVSAPYTALALVVAVDRVKLKAYVTRLAGAVYRAPRNSIAVLRNLKPIITKPRDGLALTKLDTRVLIRNALVAHQRGPLEVVTHPLKPQVTQANFGPVVVIRRGSRRLYVYKEGTRFWRTFRIAVGLPQYPTPVGRWKIVVKQRHPWWYPPDSPWAAGASPIPPGPGNPLGTRWMGLNASGVGIHGTPDAASVGYSASHGCIRMRIPEAELLFTRVRVGTPVFIVRA